MAHCCDSQTNIKEPNTIFSWGRYVFALILSGQMMVIGLAINLSPPSFGSLAYYSLHSLLLLATLIVSVLIGQELWVKAYQNFRKGKIVCEHFFATAILGALISSLIVTFTGQGSVYYEVIAILLLIYALSRILIKHYSKKITEQVAHVKEIYSHAWIAEGAKLKQISVDKLKEGNVTVVPAGEPVTVDGTLISAEAKVCSRNITGELSYKKVAAGDFIYAGYYAADSRLYISMKQNSKSRELDKLLAGLNDRNIDDTSIQNQADQIAKYFTPAVILISTLTFVSWFFLLNSSWHLSLYNAMAVLLVACPCAFGLATPLALRAAYTRLAEKGLLHFSSEFITKLTKCNSVFIDRAGTLTEQCASLQTFELHSDTYTRETVMQAVKLLEQDASHPFAQAILDEDSSTPPAAFVTTENSAIKHIPGIGISGSLYDLEGRSLICLVGNPKIFEFAPNISLPLETLDGKALYVIIEDQWIATLHFEERLRAESEALIDRFSNIGLPVEIITGGISNHEILPHVPIQSELLPTEKEAYLKKKIQEGLRPLFIGDGLNDAGASQIATCSIALNSGDILTQHVADGVISPQSLNQIPDWILYSKQVTTTIKKNLNHALLYNVFGITLAAMGVLHPVVAALLMAVSSTWVSFRSARLLYQPIEFLIK